MSNYKKLIAAAAGFIVLLIGPDGLGITSTEQATTVGEFLIMGGGLFLVWFLPNTPAPESSQANSPPLVGIGAILIACLAMGGCVSTLGVDQDRLDTANKQLADKVLFVESLANFATRLVEQRVISGQQGRQVAARLQEALNALNTTQAAIARSGDPSQAPDTLERVDRTLAIVLDLLLAFAPGQSSAIDNYKGELSYV